MSLDFLKVIRNLVLLGAIAVSTVQIANAVEIIHPTESNLSNASQISFFPKPIVWEEPTFQEKNIFILVNYHRKLNGLRTLKWDSKLAKMARYYSGKMANEDFFEHEDYEGKTVVDRAEEFRVKDWMKIGENLFYSEGFISPTQEAVDSWLDSPGHRMNMLDRDWTHTAIGVYEKRGMVTYITQVFIRK